MHGGSQIPELDEGWAGDRPQFSLRMDPGNSGGAPVASERAGRAQAEP